MHGSSKLIAVSVFCQPVDIGAVFDTVVNQTEAVRILAADLSVYRPEVPKQANP